ncbi:MAG: UDP-N-acetylmuramate dehydrogenase [bacterium]|nr:UDP-N-acetylmuramate dehydrogenase [bacterium]
MDASILKFLPGVRKNIPLAPYTTFKIGGPAKYFFVAKTEQDVCNAITAAKKYRVPMFVLAGGSNVLVSDKGFLGLVVLLSMKQYSMKGTVLTAEAGVDMRTLVKETGKRGLSGFEWAGGLPGSVGGVVRGNAGAFGGETKDSIVSVAALDKKGTIKKLSGKACAFSYRNSLFKEKNWIVLSATFQLKKGNKEKIQAIAKEHIRYRKERHPLEYPNAGSVFKNCPFSKFSKKLQNELSHIVKIDPFPVIPTAYLISEARLKGLRVGKAEVSRKHPNYIVNKGGAKAKDVLLLIEKVKKAVKKKFSVDLEVEVQYIA